MVKGMAHGGLPFPRTGSPAPVLPIFTWYEISNAWAIVSTIVHLPRLFTPTIVLWKTDCTNYHRPPLYHIYILNSGKSAGVFQGVQMILFAVFGAVDEPLASCVVVQLGVNVS